VGVEAKPGCGGVMKAERKLRLSVKVTESARRRDNYVTGAINHRIHCHLMNTTVEIFFPL
jgi:hypothetical protein